MTTPAPLWVVITMEHEVYGPFATQDDALQWAENILIGEAYWVAMIQAPGEELADA
jgi:hypothetical protein